MSQMAASVLHYARCRGSSKKVSSEVTVLPKAKWLRIQDALRQVEQTNNSIREAARQRDAMHLDSDASDTIVQCLCWSNTNAGQTPNELTFEEKKMKEEIAEEQRKLTDIEEARYQERKRKKGVAEARAQQYYETDRVKEFHHALLLTEVLKEREAQIGMKKRIQSNAKDTDREIISMVKSRYEEGLRQDKQKALEKKLKGKAFAEDLTKQVKEKEMAKEQEKLEKLLKDKKEGEKIQHLFKLNVFEQRMEADLKDEQKRESAHAHKENLSKNYVLGAIQSQQEDVEEEQRQLFISTKDRIVMLQKVKEKELFKEGQDVRDMVMEKLRQHQEQQKLNLNEEGRIVVAVAEREARMVRRQQEEEKKRAALLKSIKADREGRIQEKRQKDMVAHQKAQDTLQGKKDADRTFCENEKLKARQMKTDGRILQDFNANKMAEKWYREQKLQREKHDWEAKNKEVLAEEEKQFQQYAENIIHAAAEAGRDVPLLRNAAKLKKDPLVPSKSSKNEKK